MNVGSDKFADTCLAHYLVYLIEASISKLIVHDHREPRTLTIVETLCQTYTYMYIKYIHIYIIYTPIKLYIYILYYIYTRITSYNPKPGLVSIQLASA